jgi:hypothetical protein
VTIITAILSQTAYSRAHAAGGNSLPQDKRETIMAEPNNRDLTLAELNEVAGGNLKLSKVASKVT